MGQLEKSLIDSLYTGFIDKDKMSLEKYRPKLLLNNHKQGRKVLSSIINELEDCDEFFFSVAFITYSGVIVLLNTLKELESKGIKGKIVASQYLNFTDPTALRKLLEFENIELRMVVHEDLHSKGYIFRKKDEYNLIVGSSNLTQNALSKNKEWNIKVSSTDKGSLIEETVKEFEQTFNKAIEVDEGWLDQYELIYRREKEKREPVTKDETGLLGAESIGTGYNVSHDLRPKISPNKMQVKALRGIENLRERGEDKGLLISATGTGKTMVAAFDYQNQIKTGDKKLLFLAHRKEILDQSLYTFRNVLKDQNFGELWVGGNTPIDHTHIFASVQTLNSNENYKKFAKDYFDYIVIDESHHASASSYLCILEYFKPRILLVLTATPERMDGENILDYFNNRIASEIRQADAINRKLLSPFHYFGVTDPESLSHLKWSRGGYDISELENVYTKSKQRVQVVLDSMDKYLTDMETFKALGFCVSIKHADFMANAFNTAGIPAVALHSATSREERNLAKSKLQKGTMGQRYIHDRTPEHKALLFARESRQEYNHGQQQITRLLRSYKKQFK